MDQVPLFAGLANIIPLLALVSLWARLPKLGGCLLLFLAVPFVIGGYSHFLSAGSDNAFRMAPGELTTGFGVSAVLLWVLEFCGCWLGIEFYAAHRYPSRVRNSRSCELFRASPDPISALANLSGSTRGEARA